jgi:hypothetical protein
MSRTVRVVIAAVIGLVLTGAVVSALLGGLAWGFTLLLISGGTLAIIKLLESADTRKPKPTGEDRQQPS